MLTSLLCDNVVFFFVPDLKIVFYNNYRVSQYTWDPFECEQVYYGIMLCTFFVPDLKIVFYNNYRVSQYTWEPF